MVVPQLSSVLNTQILRLLSGLFDQYRISSQLIRLHSSNYLPDHYHEYSNNWYNIALDYALYSSLIFILPSQDDLSSQIWNTMTNKWGYLDSQSSTNPVAIIYGSKESIQVI